MASQFTHWWTGKIGIARMCWLVGLDRLLAEGVGENQLLWTCREMVCYIKPDDSISTSSFKIQIYHTEKSSNNFGEPYKKRLRCCDKSLFKRWKVKLVATNMRRQDNEREPVFCIIWSWSRRKRYLDKKPYFLYRRQTNVSPLHAR